MSCQINNPNHKVILANGKPLRSFEESFSYPKFCCRNCVEGLLDYTETSNACDPQCREKATFFKDVVLLARLAKSNESSNVTKGEVKAASVVTGRKHSFKKATEG